MTTEERLTRLERINRRLALIVIPIALASGIAVAAGAAGQTKAEIIDVSGIRVIGDDGEVNATLLCEGDVAFLSIGRDGSPGVTIGVSKSGTPSVSLQGKDKDSVATVMIDDRGIPCLFLETSKEFTSIDRRGVTNEARD